MNFLLLLNLAAATTALASNMGVVATDSVNAVTRDVTDLAKVVSDKDDRKVVSEKDVVVSTQLRLTQCGADICCSFNCSLTHVSLLNR